MYENIKYKILKVKDVPGPRFECVIQFLEPVNKIVHFFMNDRFLDEDLLINRVDKIWEREYNQPSEVIKNKKSLISKINKKLSKEIE